MNTTIIIRVSSNELEEIDKSIRLGKGRCRADLVRKAIILYLERERQDVVS